MNLIFTTQRFKELFILWAAGLSLSALADPPKKIITCRGKFQKPSLVSSNNTLPASSFIENMDQNIYPTEIEDDFRIIELALAPVPSPNSSSYTSYYMRKSEKIRGQYQSILKTLVHYVSGGNSNLGSRIWFHITTLIDRKENTAAAKAALVSNINVKVPPADQIKIQFNSILDFLIDYMKTGSLTQAQNINLSNIERPYKTRIEKLRTLYQLLSKKTF